MTFFHHRTGKLQTWARRTLWFVFVTGALSAIVIPIFSIYRKEGDNAQSVVEVAPQGVSHAGGDYIHVVGSVASVDFEDKNFRVHFEFTPHGTLAGDDGVLSASIVISLFYTTLIFPEAQIMRSIDVTMPYMQGATIDYPFDAYKSYFEILANMEKEQLHKIPVSLTFLGMLQSVEIIPTVRLSKDDLYKISIEIFTRRSPTTIGFSLFIVMIMWMLSIAIGIIAIQVIRKHRVSDEHILTLGITTLFALPALRETQPGIPAIGCASDVLGFYWNMAIIAISSIMILMTSALRWKEPSIEHGLEMVQTQHELQSEIIQNMSVPMSITMPSSLTGGPYFDYQTKYKRMPFMTDQHHQQHKYSQYQHNQLQHPQQHQHQYPYQHPYHHPYQPIAWSKAESVRNEFHKQDVYMQPKSERLLPLAYHYHYDRNISAENPRSGEIEHKNQEGDDLRRPYKGCKALPGGIASLETLSTRAHIKRCRGKLNKDISSYRDHRVNDVDIGNTNDSNRYYSGSTTLGTQRHVASRRHTDQ